MNDDSQEKKPALPWTVHLVSALSFVLVFIGGAIGGACAGFAYVMSILVFKKRGVNTGSYIFSVLIGIGAIVLYFIIIVVLVLLFPGMFKK